MGRAIGGTIDYASVRVEGSFSDPDSSAPTVFYGGFNAALYAGAGFVGTIVFEKTYDGGQTWITISQDAAGTPASYALNWASPTTTSLAMAEVEPSVYWRIRCSVYNSGGLTYRLSQGGGFVFTSYPAIGGAL
jgi:hypothetical protein